jgi:hypothetical protein
MARAAVVALAAVVLVAAAAEAQRRPRPAPRPAARQPARPAPPRPRPILIEPHRARDIVPLSGTLEGPVALDAGGRAVFLTFDGVLGRLERDGHLDWSLLVGPRGATPTVSADGRIYTAGGDGALYAVDDRGRLLWRRPLAGRPVRGVAAWRGLVAVALDTAVLELRTREGRLAGRAALGAPPSGAPVFVGTRRLVVPLASGQVAAVDGRRVVWRRTVAGAPLAPLAVAADGAILAAAADGTVARLGLRGKVLWKVALGAPIRRSPAIAEDGTVLVAAGAALVGLGPDGRERWRHPAGGEIVAGPLVADDGSAYVGTAARELRAIAAAGPVRRIPLPAAPTRGLALGDGELWVGLADLTLRRLDVPQHGLARSSWAKARGSLGNTGAAPR